MSYSATGLGVDITVDVPTMTDTAVDRLIYRMPDIMGSVAKQMPAVLAPVGPWASGPLWDQIQPKITAQLDHITKVAVGIGLVAALGAGSLGLYLYTKKKRI